MQIYVRYNTIYCFVVDVIINTMRQLTIYIYDLLLSDKALHESNRWISDARFATIHPLADGSDRYLSGNMHTANHWRQYPRSSGIHRR